MCAPKPIEPLVFFRRNLFSCPQDVREAAYKGLVRPILENGSSVWGPNYEGLIDDLEKVQKRAARFVTRNYTYEKGSMTDILKKLKWESLQKRRKDNRIILLYKGLKGRAKYPRMTLSPKIGVVGINTPWHFRYLQQVTPVLLKILEHILNARHSQILMNTQSRLQKGFTPGCSSLNAAFILSECILESAMNKQDLFLTTLDTQKAFDVVDQNSLLRKLYLDGIRGNDWLLLKELYSDCSSRIKWAGELSDPINIKQGVRQGGVLSTGHYKRYNNPLLLQLEEGYSGIKIGSISIPHVTVADDLAILAGSKSENQVMVWDVEDSSNRERYCVHPAKSHILWYKFGKKDNSDLDVFLGDTRVDVSASATHLGINRSTSQSVDIEGKISLGRKTAYSLMGAGFHGGSGLKAVRNGHVWSTFVVPRLLYGIECQLLKKKEIDSLEKFQRKCLKQLQGLPDNTSSSACLALLGIPPILNQSYTNLFLICLQL